MALDVGGGSFWMRIMLMKGFGIGGVRCISYTQHVFVMQKSVKACCINCRHVLLHEIRG